MVAEACRTLEVGEGVVKVAGRRLVVVGGVVVPEMVKILQYALRAIWSAVDCHVVCYHTQHPAEVGLASSVWLVLHCLGAIEVAWQPQRRGCYTASYFAAKQPAAWMCVCIQSVASEAAHAWPGDKCHCTLTFQAAPIVKQSSLACCRCPCIMPA